jgi:hypothetical protein
MFATRATRNIPAIARRRYVMNELKGERGQTASRRRVLAVGGGAVLAGAIGALGRSTPARAAEDGDGLVGSWLETITSTDGSFPPFQTMFTYATGAQGRSGGGLVGTASIDMTAGLKSSPTHGAWKPTADRRFAWTGHAFSFDDAGNLNGTYNIKERLTLAASGNTYSGTGTFEIVDGPGALPLTPYKVTAVRLTV